MESIMMILAPPVTSYSLPLGLLGSDEETGLAGVD